MLLSKNKNKIYDKGSEDHTVNYENRGHFKVDKVYICTSSANKTQSSSRNEQFVLFYSLEEAFCRIHPVGILERKFSHSHKVSSLFQDIVYTYYNYTFSAEQLF